jgi:hypothetical protein
VLALAIAGTLDSQEHLPARGAFRWNQIDAIVVRAIDSKEINLASVVARHGRPSIGPCAARPELHGPVSHTSCLALDSQKAIFIVDDQVVSLVDSPRQEYRMTALD